MSVCPCGYDFTHSHYLLYVQQSPTAEPDWPFVCPVRLIQSWSWNRRTPRAAEGGTPSSISSTSSSSSVPRCRAGAPTDSWRRPHPHGYQLLLQTHRPVPQHPNKWGFHLLPFSLVVARERYFFSCGKVGKPRLFRKQKTTVLNAWGKMVLKEDFV